MNKLAVRIACKIIDSLVQSLDELRMETSDRLYMVTIMESIKSIRQAKKLLLSMIDQ